MASSQPMLLGTEVPRGARRSWTLSLYLSLVVGTACLVYWSGRYESRRDALEDPIFMSLQGMRFGGARPARALQPAQLAKYGIGSTPLERAALIAIQASGQSSCGRSISMKAEAAMANEIANMDNETKAAVGTMVEAVKLKAQDMAGVTAPLGFFDPLGFSTDITEGKLLYYREAELKHGRVCMLASLGILIAEQYHPYWGGNIDVPSYIAFQETPLQQFWYIVLALVGAIEIGSIDAIKYDYKWEVNGDKLSARDPDKGRVPGDLGFDPLELRRGLRLDDAELKNIQDKELNNGRLAMIAAAGMIAQELATGKKLF